MHILMYIYIYIYIRRASGPRRCEIKKNNSLYRGFTPSYNPPPLWLALGRGLALAEPCVDRPEAENYERSLGSKLTCLRPKAFSKFSILFSLVCLVFSVCQ